MIEVGCALPEGTLHEMRDLSFENQAYRASGLNLLIAIRPETRIRRFSAHVPDITYLKKE
jgi:hypothetical protein